MALSAATRVACVLPFLAAVTVSHVHQSEAFCDREAGKCPNVLPSESAEAMPARVASLLQVQSHSLRNGADWPRILSSPPGHHRSAPQAQSPTNLPPLHHQSLYGEEQTHVAQGPTTLPPMHHQSLNGAESPLPERDSGSASDWASLGDDAPCSCQPDSVTWARPAPRPPRCIFIDLGAADGNTFRHFLKNGYGDVRNCPSGGKYEAILVEANPIFDKSLLKLEAKYAGRVRSLVSSAAYMCEGFTSFYLDTVDKKENYWGSSMSPNARDVMRSGQKHVSVPLVNVARLIMETALPEDYVLVKLDIEGSEHDIVPCLAQSRAALLIDALYVEKHPVEWSLAGAPQGALQDALATLQQQGVTTPEYNTPSL